MKKLIIMVALLVSPLAQAQGIMYLSNVGQPPAGFAPVATNAWQATDFYTGNNPGGYTLDSIQLGMTNATGNPSGLTVMIYSASDLFPELNLCTLTSSLDPLTAGIYTFTTVSNLLLLPGTIYYIVLTSATMIPNGAYQWEYSTSYNRTGGWVGSGYVYHSADGLSWPDIFGAPPSAFPQYAITATPVPEPSPSLLLLLGGGIFIYVRRAFKH